MPQIGELKDFRLGSNGTPTTLVDLSDEVETITPNYEQDVVDVTTFNGNGARAFTPGLTQGTFSVTFNYSQTVYNQIAGLLGYRTLIDFQHGINGNANGQPKDTGKCFLSSFEAGGGAVGDKMVISAEFQISGPVTRATYSG